MGNDLSSLPAKSSRARKKPLLQCSHFSPTMCSRIVLMEWLLMEAINWCMPQNCRLLLLWVCTLKILSIRGLRHLDVCMSVFCGKEYSVIWKEVFGTINLFVLCRQLCFQCFVVAVLHFTLLCRVSEDRAVWHRHCCRVGQAVFNSYRFMKSDIKSSFRSRKLHTN